MLETYCGEKRFRKGSTFPKKNIEGKSESIRQARMGRIEKMHRFRVHAPHVIEISYLFFGWRVATVVRVASGTPNRTIILKVSVISPRRSEAKHIDAFLRRILQQECPDIEPRPAASAKSLDVFDHSEENFS
jgi:hypothetical protein